MLNLALKHRSWIAAMRKLCGEFSRVLAKHGILMRHMKSHGIQCIYPPSQRRRRNKGSEGRAVIETRLARMEALLQATGVTDLHSSPQQPLSPLGMESQLRLSGDPSSQVDHSATADANTQRTEPSRALEDRNNMPKMMAMYQSPPTTMSTARQDSVRRSLPPTPYAHGPEDPVETAPVDQGESILSPQKVCRSAPFVGRSEGLFVTNNVSRSIGSIMVSNKGHPIF